MATKTATAFFLAVSLALALGACGADKTTTTVPIAQQKFCTAINDHRQRYQVIENKERYLDQESDLVAAYAARGQSVKEVAGDGSVVEWRGNVRSLHRTDDGALFAFDLPCQATFVSMDAFEVKQSDPVFQQLRALSENAPVTFSGRMHPFDKKLRDVGGFTEGSVTPGGSMVRPEFAFQLSQVRP